MTAEQAIEHSKSHDEIVAIDYDVAGIETLLAECDGCSESADVFEFWANESVDLDAQCKMHGCAFDSCINQHEEMEWRVHMRKAVSQC